jgi:general secretion pathway protein M
MNATAKLGGIKQSFSTFWEARDRRERRMLLVAAIVVALALFYLLLIDPALSGRADLEKRLPVLRQQAAEVQAMAREAGSLATADNAAAVPPLTRESLESSLEARGLKARNVSVSGELAKVQLEAVSFASTVDWLNELQKSSRVMVVDAGVEAQAQTDIVNANFTLRQQRTE